MYGTVAKMKFKPGAEQQMASLNKEYETLKVPGHVATYVYQMDEDANEFYMAVVFTDKEAYEKNRTIPLRIPVTARCGNSFRPIPSGTMGR